MALLLLLLKLLNVRHRSAQSKAAANKTVSGKCLASNNSLRR
jgi:hypothetical protein